MYKQRNLFTEEEKLHLGKRVFELKRDNPDMSIKNIGQRLSITPKSCTLYLNIYLDKEAA